MRARATRSHWNDQHPPPAARLCDAKNQSDSNTLGYPFITQRLGQYHTIIKTKRHITATFCMQRYAVHIMTRRFPTMHRQNQRPIISCNTCFHTRTFLVFKVKVIKFKQCLPGTLLCNLLTRWCCSSWRHSGRVARRVCKLDTTPNSFL